MGGWPSRRITTEDEAFIVKTAKERPEKVGRPFTHWSVRKLREYLGPKILDWCVWNNVELCFTPTYSSWANPVECHFGPLRDFAPNNSDHANQTVLTRRLHAYLRWRNANANDPGLRERLRRERARLRSERQRRWGLPGDLIRRVLAQVPAADRRAPGAGPGSD